VDYKIKTPVCIHTEHPALAENMKKPSSSIAGIDGVLPKKREKREFKLLGT
jgi:hypothetical protein